MLFPLGWECFPACQPRWDFSGHNSCCCAQSNAWTQSWDGAVELHWCSTCSWSSASRVARSSSESELSESEELSSLLWLLSVLLLTTGAVGGGGVGASAGSSGIFANLISKTSCKKGEKSVTEGASATNSSLWSLKCIRGGVFLHYK